MAQKVLINVEPEDIRVAVIEEGVLTDLFVESRHERTIVGNIYKGVVTDVVPGIQAAFVDIGIERNAFLHVQDIPPTDGDEPVKLRGRRRSQGNGSGRKMNISDYLKEGQKVIVQAIKDGIGDKGPRISQFVSLPGRYMVLLPSQDEDDSGGVSRRIDDPRERQRLKRLMDSIDCPEGSLILRTAAVDQDEKAILSDVDFLRRTWERINAKGHTAKAPALLHSDYNILYRLVRDVFTDDIAEIAVDDTNEHANLAKMLKQYLPKLKNRVLLYPSTRNILEVFDVERQIYKALRKRVWLRSGGHLVIDECEAMTAIDVNTGKFIGKEDQEATVLRTNLEAARVISRQLKLRDIGGIIAIDFIDMMRPENRQEVLREMRRCLRLDRARTTVSDVTSLGIVEMTRKRVRHSLRKTLQRECPHCGGSGMILTDASIWRLIRNSTVNLLEDNPEHDVRIVVHPEVYAACGEHHREAFQEIMDESSVEIVIVQDKSITHQEDYVLEAFAEGTLKGGKTRAKPSFSVSGKRFSTSETDDSSSGKSSRRRRRPAKRADVIPQEVDDLDDVIEEPEEVPGEVPDEEIKAEESAKTDEEQPAAKSHRRRSRGRRGGRRSGRGEAAPQAPVADEAPADEEEPLEEPAEEEAVVEESQPEPEERRSAPKDIDADLFAILKGESLSGRLAKSEAVKPEEAEEKPARRGRSRGRRRGRRGEGKPHTDEAAQANEETLSEPVPATAAERPEFTPIDEYLGDEVTEEKSEDTAESKPAAKRKTAASKTKKTAAKRKPAAKKKAAASKTKKTATRKKTAKRASKSKSTSDDSAEE